MYTCRHEDPRVGGHIALYSAQLKVAFSNHAVTVMIKFDLLPWHGCSRVPDVGNTSNFGI